MKFESIKKNCMVLLVEGVAGGKGGEAGFAALLPFALATKGERDEMRVFAENFKPDRPDWLARSAKNNDWSAMVLRAREAGLKLIDNWDVRQVGKLIELFPACVPKKYHGKKLTCYEAYNKHSDWIVEVIESRRNR
jgi:hypothetical protein